jgi:hypothetical protein
MCSYRVAGKKVRETLGTTATIPKVDDARDLARESMQMAQRGIHPVEERKRSAVAQANGLGQPLGAAIDRYLERHAAKRMRPVYFNETRRAFNYDVKPVPATGRSVKLPAPISGSSWRRLSSVAHRPSPTTFSPICAPF